MTWPEAIAVVVGLAGAAMVALSHHGIGTRTTPTPHDQPDGDMS